MNEKFKKYLYSRYDIVERKNWFGLTIAHYINNNGYSSNFRPKIYFTTLLKNKSTGKFDTWIYSLKGSTFMYNSYLQHKWLNEKEMLQQLKLIAFI